MKERGQFRVRGDSPHQLPERTSENKAQCRSAALVEGRGIPAHVELTNCRSQAVDKSL